MDIDEALQLFKAYGFESPAQVVATYEMSYQGIDVRVEVRDYGTDISFVRYAATAWQPEIPVEDRKLNSQGFSIGNPADTPEGALQNIHWQVFTN